MHLNFLRASYSRAHQPILFASLCLMFVAVFVLTAAAPVQAATADLFFSEYIEGSSNNKALEIYNGTGVPINLGAAGYNVQMYFNGSPSSTLTISLSGTVADGDVFVLAHGSANATILAQADQTNSSGWFNGDDAVVLRKGTTVIDVIGQIGFDPGTEWGSGLTGTADNTLRRKNTICAGDPNGTDVFDPSIEWDGFAVDTFGGLGNYTADCKMDVAPEVVGTNPTEGATRVSVKANIDLTFTEPVNVSGLWFDLTCGTSGNHAAAVSGGPTAFTLDPESDFVVNENCTLTIFASNVTDRDEIPPAAMAQNFVLHFDTFDVCTQTYTPIYDIQGSGPFAAVLGEVTTQGVVVGDYEGSAPALRGFYLQDAAGDGNVVTSDGIFVFNANNDIVNLGDVVRVKGNASEYQGQTQISAQSIINCGSSSVTPTDVTFPVPSADYLEQFEGMLIRLPQTMYVTEHYQLGRFGQVVVSPDARLAQPTNVVAPGAPALALQAQNDLDRIIIDDDLNNQNPDPILFGRGGSTLSAGNTLRGGDTATGIVGIMTFTWSGNSVSGNAYRVRPVNALGGGVPNFQPANPRPTSPNSVGGNLKVVSMNLLNFFNTFDGLPDAVDNCTNGVGGAVTDCRGADTQSEFDRQWPKTVEAILAIDPDVVAVNEIENDGYGPDSAIQFLTNQLNAATAPGTYAFIDADAKTGQVNALGSDAIKVGMLYKPAHVTPIGQTAVLNSAAFVYGGDSAPRSRPSLAQAFQTNSGARFVVDANHFKSKGSACDAPDAGDGQGNCNQVRVNAATELVNWLATDPTGINDTDVLIIGDLNSYAQEDPVTTIKNAGYTNLIEQLIGVNAYSYVFDGQWGYLDHALASDSLTPQVTGVTEYHINADEPSVLDYNTDFKTNNLQNVLYAPDQYRISDHDPIIIGLALDAFAYDGLYAPIDNQPIVNKVKAGSTVPVKFSLGGNFGLDIFKAGYPKARQYECSTSAETDKLEETLTAGQSGLSYDSATGQYTYAWKTQKAWAGTCRKLILRFVDGTIVRAKFEFK